MTHKLTKSTHNDTQTHTKPLLEHDSTLDSVGKTPKQWPKWQDEEMAGGESPGEKGKNDGWEEGEN